MLHESTYRAAFSGGVTSFEHDHYFLAGLTDPVLHLDEFDLKWKLVLVVGVETDFALIRVCAFTKEFATLFGVEIFAIFRCAVVPQFAARH